MISKRNILTFVLFITFGAASAHAQMMPRFGLRSGLGFSKITGDTIGAEFGMGYVFGGTMIIDALPVSLVTDVIIARRSYANAVTSTKTWDFVIPVQARFYVAPIFFVQAGGSFSYGIGSFTVSNGLSNQSISYEQDTLNRTNFAVLFGAGADVPVGFGSIQIEGRFNWGLNDRNKLPYQSNKTIGFDLLIGYLF